MNLVFLYPMKPTLAPKNNVYLKKVCHEPHFF